MQFFIAVKLTTPSEILMFDPEPISVYKQTDLNFTEKLRTSQQAPRAGVLSCTTLLGKHSIIQNQFYELPAAWTLVVVVRLQVLNSPEDIEPRDLPRTHWTTARATAERPIQEWREQRWGTGGSAQEWLSNTAFRPRQATTVARPSTGKTGLQGQCH